MRRITHTTQVQPQETVDEALQWTTIMRPVVSGPNVEQQWVLNMDQTPLWLSMHPQHALSLQGSTTVNGLRNQAHMHHHCGIEWGQVKTLLHF